MTTKKIYSAFEFNRSQAPIYRAAYDGKDGSAQVVINHDHYPDGVFEITYRPRCGFSEQPGPIDENSETSLHNFTKNDLHLFCQWFNSVQDTNEPFLGPYDYDLAKRVYETIQYRVPNSIINKLIDVKGE